jgi:NAD(P)-dependent dehydrogenase (short-subunit alcohol dehydrogenase family)
MMRESPAKSQRRTGLVTGGTRGIGLAVARALAADGIDLVLGGRRPEAEIAATLEELRSAGVRVAYVAADLRSAGERARLLETALETFGSLDVLVNNAGMAPRTRTDLLEATPESFAEVLATNLEGPYFLTRDVARSMIASPRRDGARRVIVFITSVSAEMASTSRGEYCVSKAGLSMAARLFATRLAEHAIPVFEVRPGIIATDMTAGVRERYDESIARGLVPERRWGQPEDVGRAVAALVRGELPYATGAILTLDGGLSMPRL